MSQNTLPQVETAESQTHDIIADIARNLLDSWYDEYPTSNAFGCDYTAPNGTPDGTWFFGRSNGADGAESDLGVDYINHRFPDPDGRGEDVEYIYGKYGWCDVNELLDVAPLLRQAFEEGMERDLIDESEIERFDSAIDALEDSLNGSRGELSLHDIADLIDSYDIDKLRTVLATGDEEGRVLWQMLFSKDEDGDTIQNPTSIELIEEDAGVMFVRSERYFQDDHREPDGKWYAYGVVIGIDDTDERFFMHRLESDADLRNEDFDWTFGAIKEKMGFDLYYDELVEPSDIPFDNAILLQGDVALVRRDFRTVMWERFDDVYETKVQREAGDHIEEYLEAHTDVADHDDIYTSTYRLDFRVQLDDTDALKDLQQELDIEEDEVRAEQERRGISRLSAKRRGNIIEDTLHERALEWMEANTEFDRDAIETEAEESVRSEFEETQEQVNLILGNHSVFLGPASRNRTLETQDRETLATVVVPERADGFVWHDEHDNKKIELPEGVYEFKFLQGHEDQWWQQG